MVSTQFTQEDKDKIQASLTILNKICIMLDRSESRYVNAQQVAKEIVIVAHALEYRFKRFEESTD